MPPLVRRLILRSPSPLHRLSKPALFTSHRSHSTQLLSPQQQPPSSSSVSAAEVSHFNALASTWWDPHGPSRLLHLMNPLRHDFIASCLSQDASPPSTPDKHLRYLDVGCGGGIFAESAARLPATSSVTAIDPSPSVYCVALEHAKTDPSIRKTLTYHNTSIEDFPAPTTAADKYDILTLFEVIEHVKHPAPFLESCFPFVKPGGWIVLSTIARTWTSWLTTKVVAEDLVGVVPRGTHEWSQYINEEELREWFAKQREWGDARAVGVVYMPGIGWREVNGGERWGNYFFGVRKKEGL
ncbi:hypothetical protein FGG08_001333 [Glutinoglossum americanum]|uniref:Ubiquinone biosynthesis O-methyltransferase, mitochondrial n=1 Tax=Glutinoglossum americanum TaxID=1670608 RepID=A0A9P8I2A3_9PEZI|nr:hypothetical protein FGG08_001333 [Glutinoglossum americanum]